MLKNLKMVSRILYGRGCFDQVDDILRERCEGTDAYAVFIVDDVFAGNHLQERLPVRGGDLLVWVNVDEEPSTTYVDELTNKVRAFSERLPAAVLGVGGGSVMDLAKAVSLMLTNPGSSADYQGWDLIHSPGAYHIGIPTLSGTGAEVSRTAVLIGPEKKLGINSNHTVFDQIVLDPDLTSGAPKAQRFYTGMDCYIHCVESLNGTYLNAFSRSCGEKAMDLCRAAFCENKLDNDAKLMMASYFGGLSIAHSQVGICHALSYGLSYGMGIHHGIGNCLAFDRLEEYYPEWVEEFRRIMEINQIEIPKNITAGISGDRIEKMIDVALGLTPLWENALGANWKKIMTRDKVRELYVEI